MTVSLPGFVYGTWIFVGLVTIGVVSVALVQGIRGKGDLFIWRSIKLASSLSGVLGIVFLMLSFEGIARIGFAGGPRATQILSYINARFLAAHQMTVVCARDGQIPTQACK
jgi:hypothetical protein